MQTVFAINSGEVLYRGLFNSLTLIAKVTVMLDLTHTTNERQLENQGVTKSEGKTDTEWDAAVRQSHPPKHARWGLCPIVCMYWLTAQHTHTHMWDCGNFICTTSPRLLNSTLLSVPTRRMFLPLGESQNWENNKGLHCVCLSGCEAFWVLIITRRVLRTAEPHSTSIWWTSSVETLHADGLN